MADYWTISTLNTKDGIGRPDFSTTYAMADQQNGANTTANNYIKAANTPPVWATPANTVFNYSINSEGSIDIVYNTSAAGNCTNGSHAETILLCLPYKLSSGIYSTLEIFFPSGKYAANGATGGPDGVLHMNVAGGSLEADFFGSGELDAMQRIVGNQLSDTADDFQANFSYKAF